jgi:hypothetical protein
VATSRNRPKEYFNRAVPGRKLLVVDEMQITGEAYRSTDKRQAGQAATGRALRA